MRLWVAADWRRRRAAVLGLILLTGLAGAVVLAVAAGARRTASSLERLATETSVGDVAIDVSGLDPDEVREITELPMVGDSATASVIFAIIDGVEEDLGLWILTTIGTARRSIATSCYEGARPIRRRATRW